MYQVYLYQVYLKAFCQSALSDPQGSEALRCPEEDEARALGIADGLLMRKDPELARSHGLPASRFVFDARVKQLRYDGGDQVSNGQ